MFSRTFILFLWAVFVSFVHSQCPDGGQIFEWGISAAGRNVIVNRHNDYRRMIMNGQVPGQPRGKNIQMLSFDERLAQEGRKVSRTCKMQHIIASDSRWSWVGQNVYISWSSRNVGGQDWEAAAASWFNEYRNFRYPFGSNGGVTGHYTQVIWARSNKLGCDFIRYFDRSKNMYAKLYTCNYGPGQYSNQAPYELA
ncbi:cysteine-rich venom protein VAR7-like [Atheta coriaria]|uniref:cysteine-rich venom protein VAR7-like n=1 Tax=Dalotia coriaria TaxID=877792 RepID=UPI0031F3DF44